MGVGGREGLVGGAFSCLFVRETAAAAAAEASNAIGLLSVFVFPLLLFLCGAHAAVQVLTGGWSKVSIWPECGMWSLRTLLIKTLWLEYIVH